MGNDSIPRTATLTEDLFGIDADGNVIRTKVFRHRRAGHAHPMFWVLQYRELNRRIDRSTRRTRQFTGPDAQARLDADMAETRRLLAASLDRAAARHDRATTRR